MPEGCYPFPRSERHGEEETKPTPRAGPGGSRGPRRRRLEDASMATKTPDVERHRGKPRAGKAGKGASFEPGQDLSAAPAFDMVEELDRPRPAKTRYPIDLKTFEALEAK